MQGLLEKIKKFTVKNKYIIFALIFYSVLRLINLTKPPLFNDEAIYLDWGWRETHVAGYLYYSLYDAKQPLLMWIFGALESIFSDPVFAGRIVSVFAGFLTLIGLYKITGKLINNKAALLSSVLYVIIPVFSFFDRQALMESSIAAIGVWTCYFLIRFFENKEYKYSLFLGVVLGIGFFIKTTAFIFLITSAFLIFVTLIKENKRIRTVENLIILAGTFLLVNLLLFINPQFWVTLGSNARYTLNLGELLSFPFSIWTASAIANLSISFFYLTPPVFLFCVLGIFYMLREKKLPINILLAFSIISVVLETLVVKNATDRYLVSFLPLFVVPVSYVIYKSINVYRIIGKILLLLLFLVPFALTLLQLMNQPAYILFMKKYTPYSDINYLQTFTSGYGVNDTASYIRGLSNGKTIIVGIAENTGNPESSMIVYFAKSKTIRVAYLDAQLFPINIQGYDCLKVPYPVYFVSRNNQQGGLEKFFEKIKTFINPYGFNTIGVYKLKTNCKGKTFEAVPRNNST